MVCFQQLSCTLCPKPRQSQQLYVAFCNFTHIFFIEIVKISSWVFLLFPRNLAANILSILGAKCFSSRNFCSQLAIRVLEYFSQIFEDSKFRYYSYIKNVYFHNFPFLLVISHVNSTTASIYQSAFLHSFNSLCFREFFVRL